MNSTFESQAPLGNILIAAEYRAPRSGNFIASLADLANAVKLRGRQTIFLFPTQKEPRGWAEWLEAQGFPVCFLEDEKTREEKLDYIQQLIEKFEIRLIHIHFGYLESLLLTQHEALGTALVIHDHFDFVTTLKQSRQRLSTMRRAVLYRRYHAYCISVMKKKDRWYWPAGRGRHFFIINGLSLNRAERDPLSVDERRKEIGLKDGEKLVLFLGWDLLRKGLDIAVKAVELYRQTDPSLKLGVIGVGDNGKPSERAAQFLRERGIDPASEAILYMHSYEDIFALNRAVDCYISSSRAEAFAYGILEAISQNTPVVVSDIEGTSWCWQYTKCFRYSVESPEDGAKALARALEAGKAPSNGSDLVDKYSNSVWVQQVIEVYKKALH